MSLMAMELVLNVLLVIVCVFENQRVMPVSVLCVSVLCVMVPVVVCVRYRPSLFSWNVLSVMVGLVELSIWIP